MKVVILGGCGYIGSALYFYLNQAGMDVDTVDLEWFGNYSNPKNLVLDYKYLPASFFKKYDAVILLAAHSSVQMCKDNRLSTFRNNVSNFIELLEKIDKQKFLYASSSSLYAGMPGSATEEECSFRASNDYDLSKKLNDLYASMCSLNYFGLRFATLNGPSKNMRSDLMINKMYLSAVKNGLIEVYNEQVRRPILSIRDLCRAILKILTNDAPAGIYNLASVNASVGEIAKIVAAQTNTSYVNKGFSETYDFHINTEKFCRMFNFSFTETIESIVQDIKNEIDYCNLTARDKAVIYE